MKLSMLFVDRLSFFNKKLGMIDGFIINERLISAATPVIVQSPYIPKIWGSCSKRSPLEVQNESPKG